MSLLSVVVPFHNVDEYIGETLASIARQTYRDLEVILIDDGSTDSSGEIARAFAAQDSRFTVLTTENSGPSHARNVGMNHATGEYLAFIDGDDLLPPYAYGMMLNTLEHTGSDVVTGGVRRLTNKIAYASRMHTEVFADTRLRTHLRKFSPLIRDVTVWNKIYRRALWVDNDIAFPEDLIFAEDAVGTLEAYAMAGSVDVVSAPVYYWVHRERGPQSLTQRIAEPRMLLDRIEAVRRISSYMGEHREHFQRTWQEWSLRHHIRIVIRSLPQLAPDQQPAVVEATASYLGTVPGTVIDRVGRTLRAKVMDLANGNVPSPSAPRRGLKRRATALGKVVAHTAELVTHIDGVEWHDDGQLSVRGTAAMFGVSSAHPPRIAARATWLSEATTSRRTSVLLRATSLTDRAPGKARTSFEITFDPTALKNQAGEWTDTKWMVSMNLAAGRHVFRSVLRLAPSDAPLALPPARQIGPDTWLEVNVEGGRLSIEVTKRRSMPTKSALIGSILYVETHLGTPTTSAELKLGRVEGVAEMTVPATVVPEAGGSAITAAIDLDRVAATIQADDPPPAGGLPDQWLIWLDLDGTTHHLQIADDDRAMLSTPDYVVSSRAESRGCPAITVRRAMPVVTRLAWQPDGELVISGTGPIDPDARIVLRLVSQREDRVWPLSVTSDGWIAVITPAQAPMATGALPLRRGNWRVLLRTGGTQGPLVDLPIDPDALDSVLSVPASVAERTFWLSRIGVDGLLLTSAGRMGDDQDHRAALRHFREVRYPRQRRVAPLRDAVLYASFAGRQYSDSPRAIHEELVRRGLPLEHIWLANDGQVNVPPTARPISNDQQAYFDALATSKYVVVNNHLPHWFRRREGQVVVQTWHGTPLKRLAFDVTDHQHADKAYLEKLAVEVPQWSYLVSPNSFSTPHLTRAFRYEGEVLAVGYPRNDVLATDNPNTQASFRLLIAEKVGIPADKKIILYAPTWRDNEFYAAGRYKLSFQFDTAAAARALGDDYVLLVRRHPSIVDDVPGAGDGFVFDVSAYPDMADLMAAADVLITDYSSVMFDFAVTGRPMLFFTYDLEFYRDSLRGFYFDFEDAAPGPVLLKSDEVIAALQDIDGVVAAYRDRYRAFRERFCDLDDGKATARVVDHVFGS